MTTAHRTTLLPAGVWRSLSEAHAARADHLTAGWRLNRSPVDAFLFDYCYAKPGLLRRWHPGPGVLLEVDEAEEAPPHTAWQWYAGPPEGSRLRGIGLDVEAFGKGRRARLVWLRSLMQATADRPAYFGCFGLHEWAMLYRQDPATQRHKLPLRLGQAGTDEVVERMGLRCTHFDAFRFFTPAAAPLNRLQPTRARQTELDQPGCLHANMDLLKWCLRMGPLAPGDLLLDAFELALEMRRLDMQASPYDLSGLGEPCVAVETPEGRAEYVRQQQAFAGRAAALRQRLIELCDLALEAAEPPRVGATAVDGGPGWGSRHPHRGSPGRPPQRRHQLEAEGR